jgi:hypothetical protein
VPIKEKKYNKEKKYVGSNCKKNANMAYIVVAMRILKSLWRMLNLAKAYNKYITKTEAFINVGF